MKNKIWLKIYQLQKLDELLLNIRDEKKNITIEAPVKSLKQEFKELVFKILKDYEKFKFNEISSVEITKMKGAKDFETKQRIELLKNVTLMEHTRNIVNEIEQRKELFKNENEYYTFYLLALLHDAGKSKLLRLHYKIPNNIPHEKASRIYASKMLNKTSFQHVVEILNKSQNDSAYFFTKLHEIDKIARQKELELLKNA